MNIVKVNKPFGIANSLNLLAIIKGSYKHKITHLLLLYNREYLRTCVRNKSK